MTEGMSYRRRVVVYVIICLMAVTLFVMILNILPGVKAYTKMNLYDGFSYAYELDDSALWTTQGATACDIEANGTHALIVKGDVGKITTNISCGDRIEFRNVQVTGTLTDSNRVNLAVECKSQTFFFGLFFYFDDIYATFSYNGVQTYTHIYTFAVNEMFNVTILREGTVLRLIVNEIEYYYIDNASFALDLYPLMWIHTTAGGGTCNLAVDEVWFQSSYMDVELLSQEVMIFVWLGFLVLYIFLMLHKSVLKVQRSIMLMIFTLLYLGLFNTVTIAFPFIQIGTFVILGVMWLSRVSKK